MVNSTYTHERLSWDQYGMLLAHAAALRSEDPYIQVGAAALRSDHSVAGTGYNGVPSGINISWEDRDQRRKYVCHAEINCLRYAKPSEVETIYTTLSPCADCIKTIGAFGIKRVLFSEIYDKDNSCFDIGKVFGISIEHFQFNPQILIK
jgi:dCMP deaminase